MTTPTIPPPSILIACLGNIFLGDDAFGVAVARRLAGRPLPAGVRLVDFGIRGLDLTLTLLDDTCEVVILVDAVSRGGPPGTLYVIEPEVGRHDGAEAASPLEMPIETHALDPARVLQVAAALGGRVRRVLLVGCEPSRFEPEADSILELSRPVQAAVDEAAALVERLVDQIRSGQIEVPARLSAVD
jgi:hydrogenase maturation protease